MVRGGITVEDNAMLAANVQLISNHHDVYGLRALPFSPVRVGRHAVVGADCRCHKELPDYAPAAGQSRQSYQNLDGEKFRENEA